MLHKLLRASVVACASLSLSGCLTFGHIQDRGASLNDSIGQMQNRALLLNVVRASRGEPLYFTTLNQAQAQATFDLKFGAPSTAVGAGLTASQRAITINPGASTILDNSTFTNFSLQLFSTKDFYAGLLTPLTLSDIYMLLKQGFPRELIFYLIIDSAKVTPEGGVPKILFNDPASSAANRQLFEAYIKQAMVHGLTLELAPARRDATQGAAASASPTAAAHPTVRLCFERALITGDDVKQDFDEAHRNNVPVTMCGESNAPGPESHEAKPAASESGVKVVLGRQTYTIEVSTRSTYAIFKYLGQVVAHEDTAPRLVDYHIENEITPEGQLLTVRQGGISGPCFADVAHAGGHYCVPDQNGQISRTVFDVLNTLVDLKQSPSDLPQTSTVLIGG
jgi:hypothetical protein